MTESSGHRCPWMLFVALVSTNAAGQSFSHSRGSEHFEALVSAERVVVKERFQGATTIYGDLSCPLGPAVKAHLLSSAQSRLCLTFVKDRCTYTRYQDGVAVHTDELANTRMPKMCIALANVNDARQFAALINKGPQHSRPATAVAPMPAAEGAAAGESKAAPDKSDGPAAAGDRAPTRSAETPPTPKAKAAKKKPRSARKSAASRARTAAGRKAKTATGAVLPNPTPARSANE